MDYVNDGGGKGTDRPFDIISSGPIRYGQYLELPQVNVDMGSAGVVAAAARPGGLNPSQAPSAKVMSSLSGIILQALNAIHTKRATYDEMKAYIAGYDRALAARFTGRGAKGADAKRLAAIREFISLEREFLAKHDQHLFENSYRGGFGDSVRQILAAEANHHSKFWQNEVLASFAILGTGLASGAATGNYMPSSLWDIYFQSQKTTAALNTAFEKHFAGIRSQQIEFTIKLSTETRKIRVSDIHELREKCRAIYRAHFGVSG